jgi:trk system potassium uptake protein TrkH
MGLIAAYLIMLLSGAIVLRMPGATVRVNEMGFPRAVFTAVNAGTLTGFQQPVGLDEYGPSGAACVLTLMVGGTLFTLIVGGLALNRLLRLPHTDGQIIRGTVFTYIFLVACGTAMLAEGDRGLMASASQAAAAFGNCGLHLGRLPGSNDGRTYAALLPLMVLGGFSIPVIMELFDALFRRRSLSRHTLVVLTFTAGLYLIGLVALFPWQWTSGVGSKLAAASTLSLDSRTCGLPFVTIGTLSRPAQWVLIALMLIGAAPAGTGGGMKVTALFHLFLGTRRALRGEKGLRITGIAAGWVGIYLLIVFLTLLGLLGTLPELPADRLVFLAVSAVGNVGLSHDPVSITGTGPGVMFLCLGMVLGRIAPLLVLWWAALTTGDADVGV